MALVPLLESCVKSKCTKLSLTDTTGVYHVTTNPTGYGATNNIVGSGSSGFSATIAIDGATAIDVASQVASTVVGEFTYTDIEIALVDGWHTIVYKVGSTAAGIKTNTIKIFTYCSVKCCIHAKMLELMDFDPCKDASKIATYMHMWGMYQEMIYAASGCNASLATELLTRLQAFCGSTTDCGCN